MKLLITGGTGFLGSHLVKALLNEGHQIILIKRSSSNTWRISNILPYITSFDIDTCSIEQIFRDHENIDTIIHTATNYGRNSMNLSDILEANLSFPLKLLDHAASFGVKRFINTDTILKKDINFYALSKKQFLEWGRRVASLKKIRFMNIRLEHIYGPMDDDTKFTTYVIKGCMQNVTELKLTAGEQVRDFIYIDDVILAYSCLLHSRNDCSPYFKEYTLGSGNPVSIRYFVELVHKITNSNTLLRFGAVPYRKDEPMVPEINNRRAEIEGWKVNTDLKEGIKKIIQSDYYRWYND